jgi:hypothetical protein
VSMFKYSNKYDCSQKWEKIIKYPNNGKTPPIFKHILGFWEVVVCIGAIFLAANCDPELYRRTNHA